MGRGKGPAGAGDDVRRLLVLAVVLLTGCASSTSSTSTWVLLGIFLIAAEASDPTRPLEERPPDMDPSRRVNEQDCTQPIVDGSANLRCK